MGRAKTRGHTRTRCLTLVPFVLVTTSGDGTLRTNLSLYQTETGIVNLERLLPGSPFFPLPAQRFPFPLRVRAHVLIANNVG